MGNCGKMLRALIAHSVLLALATAQDTHYCPDGWDVVQGRDPSLIECVLLGGLEERVTKADAELICAGHGGWVVDMDEGHGPAKNNALKKLISDKQGQNNPGTPGYNFQDQWWIGATCNGPHGEHNQGNWVWDHSNTTVEWYDWYDDEPNDWHHQNCLTFLKDQDIFGFGVYHWNDWGCDYVARYICEKAPMKRSAKAETKPDQSPPSAKYRHLRRLWR